MQVSGYFALSFFDVSEAFESIAKYFVEAGRIAEVDGAVGRAPDMRRRRPRRSSRRRERSRFPTGETLDSRIKYYWFGVACVELVTPFACELDALPTQSYRWMNAPEVEKAAEDLLHARLSDSARR